MAKIEIDESEYNRLTGIRATVAKMATSPESKKLLQRAHKLVDPNAETPDLDAEEKELKIKSELEQKYDTLQAEIKADREKRDADAGLAAANAKWEAGRQALRESRYTPEGIEAVEKFMTERGIHDHAVAAAYIEKNAPAPDVVTPHAFGGFNFVEPPKDDDKFLKALLETRGESDNAVIQAAGEAIRDVRGARR